MSTPTASPDDILKARLADYLGHLESVANKGGEFLAQQVPDVVRELIAWTIATSIMEMVLGVAIVVATILLGPKVIRSLAADDPSDGVLFCMALVVALGAIVGGLIAFGEGLQSLVKCIVAPKLFVLDYVLNMVKPK